MFLTCFAGLDFLDNGSIFEHAITCAGKNYLPHLRVHHIIIIYNMNLIVSLKSLKSTIERFSYRIWQIPLFPVGAMRSHLLELCHIRERRVFRIAVGAMRLQPKFHGQRALERRTVVG